MILRLALTGVRCVVEALETCISGAWRTCRDKRDVREDHGLQCNVWFAIGYAVAVRTSIHACSARILFI